MTRVLATSIGRAAFFATALAVACLVAGAFMPPWSAAATVMVVAGGGFAFQLHRWHASLMGAIDAGLQSLAELRALVALQDGLCEPPVAWSEWALSPRTLTSILRELGTRGGCTVLECGTGVSTLHLARALSVRGRGHVFGLEQDAAWARRVREALERRGLARWATVIDAPLQAVTSCDRATRWYAIPESALPPDLQIEVLVVDGPIGGSAPLTRLPALPFLWSRLAPGATIFLDDAQRPDEAEIGRIWTERFSLRATRVPAERGVLRLERISEPTEADHEQTQEKGAGGQARDAR